MSLKYGDSVVLIQKSPDGVIRRVNAIVLASAVQPQNVPRGQALRDHSGHLPEGEYLDLAFPDPGMESQSLKTRDFGLLFRPTYMTPPWQEGAFIGWEAASKVMIERIADLTVGKQNLQKELAAVVAKINTQKVAPVSELPSSNDLDVVSEESAAAEATSGVPAEG